VAAYQRASGKACKQTSGEPSCTQSGENELIALIKNTVAPTSWNDLGGPCSLEYFPLTHSLVINAPPEVHEQIAELFEEMRRWLELEVSCELRFISVADHAYDRLKKDFAFKDVKDGPMASFDDKQVFELMEAVQADQRTHVMQAPKITLFDGQATTIRVVEERPFITGVTLRWSEEGLITCPQRETIPLGFQISLQPSLSTDHRYLDLNLEFERRSLETIEPALVPTQLVMKEDSATRQRVGCLKVFPASPAKLPQIRCDEKDLTELKPDQKGVVFTQFIQAPKVNKVSLERNLVLPEGKTAVLFGWKQTTEVTDAVPVLSKLPYIGKHYQRVHQEPETVLVLVTPRVVVPEKTEELLPPKPLEAKGAIRCT